MIKHKRTINQIFDIFFFMISIFVINIFILKISFKNISILNFKSNFQRNRMKKSIKIRPQSLWIVLPYNHLLIHYIYNLWSAYNYKITHLKKRFIKSSFFPSNYFLTHYRLKFLFNLSVIERKLIMNTAFYVFIKNRMPSGFKENVKTIGKEMVNKIDINLQLNRMLSEFVQNEIHL